MLTCKWHARSWNRSCFQGGLPWWTWQAEEPTEELDPELLTGRRSRDHSSTSARTPGDCQKVQKEICRENDILAVLLIDRWCAYCVMISTCTFHLEVLSVFSSLPSHSSWWAVLKMASRLLHPKNRHRQKQRWSTDKDNTLMTALVYLVLPSFSLLALIYA